MQVYLNLFSRFEPSIYLIFVACNPNKNYQSLGDIPTYTYWYNKYSSNLVMKQCYCIISTSNTLSIYVNTHMNIDA